MAQTTVNPYEEIGSYLPNGLESIIGSLPGSPTIDQLVTAVYNYIAPVFYESGGADPTTQVQLEIMQVARTAINSYVNNLVQGGQTEYNSNQMRFIDMLIGSQFTANLPIVSIGDRIKDVQDNLTDNSLTVPEQTTLLLASSIGGNANIYWQQQVALGGGSSWYGYFPTSPENYMDIPYYVQAAMVGALAGYGATAAGMIEPSVNFVTNKQVSALIGALTVSAGKVVFRWIPRIQHANPMAIGGGFGGGALDEILAIQHQVNPTGGGILKRYGGWNSGNCLAGNYTQNSGWWGITIMSTAAEHAAGI